MYSTKTILNLLVKLNKATVIFVEQKENIIYFNNKEYKRNEIYVHVEPYKQVRCCCPKCNKKCPQYDQKYTTEAT